MNGGGETTRQLARAPVLGHLARFKRDPLQFLRDCSRIDDVTRLKLVKEMFLIAHPDGVEHILVSNHRNYAKGFGYDRMRPAFGRGLLTNEGADWKIQRRMIQPAFHRQMLSPFVDAMARRGHELVLRSGVGTPSRWPTYSSPRFVRPPS